MPARTDVNVNNWTAKTMLSAAQQKPREMRGFSADPAPATAGSLASGSNYVLTARRLFPGHPDKQTFSVQAGTSHLCHQRKS
jgi:hypothetical protein